MRELHAVIAVWHVGPKTYYVKRSEGMENYPGVWTHMSLQFRPDDVPDNRDLPAVQKVVDRLSAERLGGTPVRVLGFMIAATSDRNPIRTCVHLSMYRVELPKEPELNPRYYVDARWMTPEQYLLLGSPPCGTCIRMWSDYCMDHGISTLPLAAPLDASEYRV